MIISNRFVAVLCGIITLASFIAIFGTFFASLDRTDTAIVVFIQIALSVVFAIMARWSWYAETWVPTMCLGYMMLMGLGVILISA